VVDHAELVQRLGETPTLVRALTPSPDPADHEGWTPQVILGHIAYVDEHVWLPRLHEMATVDVPRWQWWEPAGIDWLGIYGRLSWAEVVEQFATARAATCAYLGGLSDAGWARRARHSVFGELAVAGLCEEILTHDHDHLAQLRGQGRHAHS
jgi:DinB superfamily